MNSITYGLCWNLSGSPGLLAKIVQWVSLEYIWGVTWPQTLEVIPEPSHGRVFGEKFHSAYVVKGVWSLLTDLLFNRQFLQILNLIKNRRWFKSLQQVPAISHSIRLIYDV